MHIDHEVWNKLEARHQELQGELVSPDLDSETRLTYQKEFSQLDQILDLRRRVREVDEELEETRQQQAENTDEELAELFEEEIADLEQKRQAAYKELDDLLHPPSELDQRSVFLEIRSGTGGQEAALFAANLLRMYTAYALNHGWKSALVSSSPTDLGGYREVIMQIKGKGAYGLLKHESGVHRVQRVPETETGGRVHTSTATVAVLPEAREVDIQINQSDLRVDTFRASGAGGQHVNTTDSAIRITHLPTGVVVACQDERSQHKNRTKAMQVLQSRLLSAEREKQEQEESRMRKEQVGGAKRSEKVRTYNFPQNRITDHQVNVTLKKLEQVMQGQLDEILEALQDKEREKRRQKSSIFSRYLES